MHCNPHTRKDRGKAGPHDGVETAASVEVLAGAGEIGDSEIRSGGESDDGCV